MVITVLHHVSHCYSNADGDVIYNVILKGFDAREEVIVSFLGVDSVSSSFVNSAFIQLLDKYDFSFIKRNLRIINSTKQINYMIKSRFEFETTKRKNMVGV
jgi:hypothetical protein